MPKPNDKFTLAQMKDYIRSHKNVKIKLTQKRADLIADLKKVGQWEGSTPSKKAPAKAPVKPSESIGQQNLQELLKLGDLSSKIQKAASKEKMLKAYKIIGERKKKLDKGHESGDAFTTLIKYKSGKKKGQVRITRQTSEQAEQERKWRRGQIKEIAESFNMPYKNPFWNWDTYFRKKYGNDEANELSIWV